MDELESTDSLSVLLSSVNLEDNTPYQALIDQKLQGSHKQTLAWIDGLSHAEATDLLRQKTIKEESLASFLIKHENPDKLNTLLQKCSFIHYIKFDNLLPEQQAYFMHRVQTSVQLPHREKLIFVNAYPIQSLNTFAPNIKSQVDVLFEAAFNNWHEQKLLMSQMIHSNHETLLHIAGRKSNSYYIRLILAFFHPEHILEMAYIKNADNIAGLHFITGNHPLLAIEQILPLLSAEIVEQLPIELISRALHDLLLRNDHRFFIASLSWIKKTIPETKRKDYFLHGDWPSFKLFFTLQDSSYAESFINLFPADDLYAMLLHTTNEESCFEVAYRFNWFDTLTQHWPDKNKKNPLQFMLQSFLAHVSFTEKSPKTLKKYIEKAPAEILYAADHNKSANLFDGLENLSLEARLNANTALVDKDSIKRLLDLKKILLRIQLYLEDPYGGANDLDKTLHFNQLKNLLKLKSYNIDVLIKHVQQAKKQFGAYIPWASSQRYVDLCQQLVDLKPTIQEIQFMLPENNPVKTPTPSENNPIKMTTPSWQIAQTQNKVTLEDEFELMTHNTPPPKVSFTY